MVKVKMLWFVRLPWPFLARYGTVRTYIVSAPCSLAHLGRVYNEESFLRQEQYRDNMHMNNNNCAVDKSPVSWYATSS